MSFGREHALGRKLTWPCRYGDLLLEWRTGVQSTSCEKAQWEDKYTKLHREVRWFR